MDSARRDRADRKGSGRNAPASSRDKAGRGARRTGPAEQSARSRESRSAAPREPTIPDGATIQLLDREVRADLRSLSKPTAEIVGAHLAAAGLFLDDDPLRALDHARAARARAARIGAVREAVGIAAYRAQQWAEALSELRAARRITGDPRNLAVMADTERALGRPAQALRMLDDPDVARLNAEARAELLIVVAGARRDLGQMDAALSVLARGGLDTQHPRPGSVRLWYAYADALQAAGRTDDAARWFAASAALDTTGETDAAERAAELL
jgi:tetratricopeptide (TPR) repeat protein